MISANGSLAPVLTFPAWSSTSVSASVSVGNWLAMIAPFSSVSYPLTGHPRQAHWSVINDYGGNSAVYHAAVQSGETP